MHVGNEDFFEGHGIDGLNGGAKVIADREHGRLETVGGEDGKATASAHFDNAWEARKGGFRWEDESQSTPAVEERFLVVRVDDAAAIDEGDLVGNLLHIEGVVRGEEDGAVLVSEYCHQFLQDLMTGYGIKAGGGLVEDQEAGATRESEKERCLDPLPMRQPLNFLVRLEVEAPKQLVGIGLVPARIDGAEEVHVPGEGCRAVEAHVFGDEADVELGGRLL